MFILYLAAALYTKDKVHMCAFLPSKSANSSRCVNDTSKCEKVPCSKGVYGCVTVYKNKTGVLTPVYMGCHDIDEFPNCGSESCALEHHNDHYSCCCYESMCNINTTLKFPATTTTQIPSSKFSVYIYFTIYFNTRVSNGITVYCNIIRFAQFR